MFTRRDFREYVAELREIELKMQTHYATLVDRIDDDALRMRFVALMQSEREHAEGLERLETIALGGSDLARPPLRWTIGRKVGVLVGVLLFWVCGALVFGWVMQTRLMALHNSHVATQAPFLHALGTIREGSLRQRLDVQGILRDFSGGAGTASGGTTGESPDAASGTASTGMPGSASGESSREMVGAASGSVPLPVRIEAVEIRNRGIAAALRTALDRIQDGNNARETERDAYRPVLVQLHAIQALLPQVVEDTDNTLRAIRLQEPEIPRPLLDSMETGWAGIDAAAESAEEAVRALHEESRLALQEERERFRTFALFLGLGGILAGTLLGAVVAVRLRNHFRTMADAARQVTECVMADNIPTANVEVTGSDEAAVLAYLWNAMVTAFSDDIRRRKKLEAELSLNATTDRLTGALNRRKCEETMISEVARAQRYKTPLSLLLVDIDGFRTINETHGLEVGDSVIAKIGELVRSLIRDSDFLFRFGGEEFLVLGPSTDAKGAAILGEKIQVLVTKTDMGVAGRVTVSIGISEYREGDDVRSLLKRVDDALYAAKRAGRNSACTA